VSRLGARIVTGTTLAVLAAGLLWLDARLPAGRLPWSVATVLGLLSAWELDRMGRFRGQGHGPALATVCAGLAAGLLLDWPGLGPGHDPLVRLAMLYVHAGLFAIPGLVVARIVGGRGPARTPLGTAAMALWLLPALFALVLVDHQLGVRGLVALVVLAKVGDNAGFFVGRAIGKRHPFPGISPGKTVAGCVASLVAGVVTGALLLPTLLTGAGGSPALVGGLVGGALNLAAQASDLSESWVKRRADVKDSGRLAGPSGGVLDVIDSLFFAAPLAVVLFRTCYGAAPTPL
jgi:phosphatidate cytidylyltransferase